VIAKWRGSDHAVSTASASSASPPRGVAGASVDERNAAPGHKSPPNTDRGGVSYVHSGMYALQESVRQMRGTPTAQIPDAKISIGHGVGGMFASGAIIMSNEAA
jgi:hypothetical protein